MEDEEKLMYGVPSDLLKVAQFRQVLAYDFQQFDRMLVKAAEHVGN